MRQQKEDEMESSFAAIDPLTLTLAGVAGLALVLAAILLMGRARREDEMRRAIETANVRAGETADRLAASQAELAGRLSQLAESQVTSQAAIAETLRTQEREVARKLDERLADVTRRVGDSIEKTGQQSQISLTDLRERLAVIDAAQKNITELSTQVVGLQDILSNKQARGTVGEIQLADLVRSVLPPNAYRFQETIGDGKRVDCLLALPNPPGSIAIDAKFPLEAFHQLVDAEDDAARDQARKALGRSVLKHVKDIAEKYIVPGETADSALMFLPSESIYAELHANLPAVIEQSFRQKVWIVAPTTLMATLNTVRAVLKDAAMSEQAHVIQGEVRKLLDDVGRLDDRVGKLQRHFGQAEEDIRQIRVSTEKITKRGERIESIEMGEMGDDADQAPAALSEATVGRIEAAE
jgi:DNA recombination protein RmuC